MVAASAKGLCVGFKNFSMYLFKICYLDLHFILDLPAWFVSVWDLLSLFVCLRFAIVWDVLLVWFFLNICYIGLTLFKVCLFWLYLCKELMYFQAHREIIKQTTIDKTISSCPENFDLEALICSHSWSLNEQRLEFWDERWPSTSPFLFQLNGAVVPYLLKLSYYCIGKAKQLASSFEFVPDLII